MKLPSLLASTSLLALAACGGPSSDAQFASADAAHLNRAFAAASGVDLSVALTFGMGYATLPSTSGAACPQIQRTTGHVSVVGNCVMSDGSRLSGSVDIDNAPDLSGNGYDPAIPIDITFRDFWLTSSSGDDIKIDGQLSLGSHEAVIAADLAYAGISSRDDLNYVPHGNGLESFEAAAGSTIVVDGLGGAEVSGVWSWGDASATPAVPPSGRITLAGADTLVIDLGKAGQGSSSCFGTTIDGAVHGDVCLP